MENLLNKRVDFIKVRYKIHTLPHIIYPYRSTYISIGDNIGEVFVETIRGKGVDNTDPKNPIINIPNQDDFVTLDTNQTITGTKIFQSNVTANSFVKSGGASTQFLKADGSVDNNSYALDSDLHSPVSLGNNENGLSLASNQILSLGLASVNSTGALSAADFNIFNAKQNAGNFVTIDTAQTITGRKTFDNRIIANDDIRLIAKGSAAETSLKNIDAPSLVSIGSNGFGFNNANNIYFSGSNKGGGIFAFNNSSTRTYTLPNAPGTIALTSNLHNAVTLGTENGLSLAGQVLSLGLASTSDTGALSAANFNIFNAKVGGSGTTNFLSKFTGSGTIGNSQVFDNGVSIGIGTNTPHSSRFIDIIKDQNSVTPIVLSNLSTNAGASAQFAVNANGASGFFGAFNNNHSVSNWSGRAIFGANENSQGITISAHNSGQDIRFLTNDTFSERMRIISNGNVLINTTVDSGEKLNVNGKARIQDIPNGIGDFITRSATGVLQHRTAAEVATDFNIGGNFVTIDTNQTITGFKNFTDRIDVISTGGATGRLQSGATSISLFTTSSADVHLGTNNLVRVIVGANGTTQFAGGIAVGGYTPSLIHAALFNGNVGIGTTDPSAKLEVVRGSNGASAVFQSGDGTNNTGLSILHTNEGVNINLSNPFSGAFNNLIFSNSSVQETMRITSAGNVGIGTTAPSAKLEVRQTGDAFIKIKGNFANNSGIIFSDIGLNFNSCAIRNDRQNNALWFSTNGINSERLRITSTGNVGIGTTTPGSKLSIVGLPTSSAGLSAGDIFNDNGTLKIV